VFIGVLEGHLFKEKVTLSSNVRYYIYVAREKAEKSGLKDESPE